MFMVGLKFGLGPKNAFPLSVDEGWKVEGISLLGFEKKLLRVPVPSPNQMPPTSSSCHCHLTATVSP